ncbi:hypothetical protein AB0O20_06260 [Streptomyces kronopolitis]|uniref:aggregation-promoting factor C-terminal-like domain-containing protein n=1 Tax=Streptomyces kronopolitis TaxID=1612435 RepID=UPI00344951F0
MAISVGSVEVDVVPNTRGIHRRLTEALIPAAEAAGELAGSAAGERFGPAMSEAVGDTVGERIGTQIGQQIASRITASVRGALQDGISQGGAQARASATRQGEETGGAFSRGLKARLEAAFRSMPRLDVGIDDTGVDAELARLRARMETLAGKRIGVDVDVAAADAEIADIEERLRRLGAAHPNIAVRADTGAARAQLEEVRAEIARLSADPTQIRLETDGTFGARMRAAVQAAQSSLPNINVGADTSQAEAELASLRGRLTALADQRVGIDIDAAAATAQITDIQARLARLSASDADVNVRVDAAAAEAQLAAVGAMVSALDGADAHVKVDTAGAVSAILQLTIAIGGLAAIPAIPVLAAGIGSIAAAGVAAGVGVGGLAAVALPAFTGIKNALDAQKQAQDAATTATSNGGQAASQAAAKALQMAGAQQALAAAHRNAARQIAQAEQGISDAARTAAQNNTAAADQVKQARKSLADAYQQAADRTQSANDRVTQAEQSLADAQRAARQAQQDLTQARHDAAVQLEELSTRVTDAQLSERDAALGVQEARQRLLATQAVGSKATVLEQQRAQLGYDQAVQRLKEQQAETKSLTAQKAAADKAGVEGSTIVQSAQERLAAAQRNVAGQQAGLAKAQQDAARTQVQNQQAIAAAQDKVAAAQRNVAKVQEDGARSVARAQQQLVATQQSAADSITSAQRQIQSAQMSAAGGANTASAAQAKYAAALAKLSPSARQTMAAFTGLKGAFTSWSTSLQPAVMPIFTRALNGLKAALPALTPIVLSAAGAIKRLQDRASAGFKSPWWKSLKADLTGAVGPAITGLGVSFGNVFKGMAGVIDAFLPHMDGISSRMQSITKVFAGWGAGLKGSPAFEGFLRYAAEMGPRVAETVGKIFSAAGNIGQALSPISGPLLGALGAVAEAIGIIADKAPWMIQLIYGIIVATKLWTLANIALTFVMKQNPLVRVAMLIGLLVGAVIYAYNKFSWFREGVQTVWQWLKDSYNQYVKPFVDAFINGFAYLYDVLVGHSIIPDMVNAILWWIKLMFTVWGAIFRAIRTVVVWLWQSVLQPFFTWVGTAVMWVWNNVLKPVFSAFAAAFHAIATAATWLWQNVLSPVFSFISVAARILFAVLVVAVFGPIILAVKALGAIAFWLWTVAIKPAFEGIAFVALWLWNNAVKPTFELLKAGVRAVGAVARWLWQNVIKPAFNGIGAVIGWVWRTVVSPIFAGIKATVKGLGIIFSWLWKTIVRPVFGWIGDRIGWVWKNLIKPPFDAIKRAVSLVGEAFGAAKNAIKKSWDQVVNVTKKPVNFVIKWVYTNGIKALWDKVAGWVGLGKLPAAPKLLAAGGAVGDGFGKATPMRVNRPTAIVGEGNPRYPEYVIPTDPKYRNRAVALHQAAGTQLMADGGILGDIWGGIKSAGGWIADKATGALKAAGKFAAGALAPAFNLGLKAINGTLSRIPGADTGLGKVVRAIPSKVADGILSFLRGEDEKSMGGANVAKALTWAKSQAGKPYQWGGTGNPSWDCSGFMGAIQKVIEGRNPKGRIWSTFGFQGNKAPAGWERHLKSPFQIGVTNAGKGHTAGTLAGTNVESRGGDGVVVGSRARGYNAPLFHGNWYGLASAIASGGGGGSAKATARQMLGEFGWSQKQWPSLDKLWTKESGWRWNAANPSGAYGIPQALPGSKMKSAGADWRTNPATQIKWGLKYIKGSYGSPAAAWRHSQSVNWYDSGGLLQPGLNLAYNGTGRPEPVFTTRQANALVSLAGGAGAGSPARFEGDLYLDSGEFLGRVRGEATQIAQAEVRRSNTQLAGVLRAGRRG